MTHPRTHDVTPPVGLSQEDLADKTVDLTFGHAVGAAMNLLGPDSDELWGRYQDTRYEGTHDIIEIRRGLLREIGEFVDRDAPAAELFSLFDPTLALLTDPGQRLQRYEQICVDNFEFRAGRERQQSTEELERPRDQVGELLWDTAFKICDERNSELPEGDAIKCMAILGGTKNAIENRTKFALEQLKKHGATTDNFDFLMSEGEFKFAEDIVKLVGVNPEAKPKIQQLPEGRVMIYEAVDLQGKRVPVRIFVANDKPLIDAKTGKQAIDKETGEPKMRRAVTLETYALWQKFIDAQPGDRLVPVTTKHYQFFQNMNGLEVFTWKNGVRVDVIGHSAEWAGMKRYANQLLQEYKAGIDSMWRLYQKGVDTGLVPEIPKRYEVQDVAALYEPVPDMSALRAGKEGYKTDPINTEGPLHREPVVDIASYGLAGQAYYSRPNAANHGEVNPDVPRELCLRRSVAEELRRINEGLADPAITRFFGGDVELYIEDGLRQPEMQQQAHDVLVPDLIRAQTPDITDAELEQKVADMISTPTTDPEGPSPHLTAGAFDVVLRFKQTDKGYVPGAEVPMGHVDGAITPQTWPDYFEHHEPTTPEERQAQRNRRAFAAIMTGNVFGKETAFAVNPTEFFHWGRGDQLSARAQRLSGDEKAYAYYSAVR